MANTPVLPSLGFAERFRVKSRSGNQYVVRFLHRGEGDAGVFVRLDKGEIARLDPKRLKWSTYESASDIIGKGAVKTGDDVLVECAAGSLRGNLASPLGETMLRLENGLCIQNTEVYGLFIMFRAPSLKGGDRFWIKSNSGRDYSGTALNVTKDNARVRLTDRSEVTLRLSSLDVDSLFVAIPIPRSAYVPDK